MCGIIACVGGANVVDDVIVGLENLEYRGYDSAGVALHDGRELLVSKREGEISELNTEIRSDLPDGRTCIGHTRWSTHGPPTDYNAHPHTDCTGRVAVVHNGIIENHAALREELQSRGHTFASDTDTEVIPHLVEEHLADGRSPEESFRRALSELEGSYAIAMLVDGQETVYASRDGSPLIIGVDDGRSFLASDAPAFLEFTDRAVFLQDGDVAAVGAGEFRVTDLDGAPVEREVRSIEWEPEDARKNGYDHYMLKEIHEQPSALRRTIHGRLDEPGPEPDLDFPNGRFAGVDTVHLVACGTSYHAALYCEQLMARQGITARAFLASEYPAKTPPLSEDTLVVGVTQSGETADTLGALEYAASDGAETLAVTNVLGSSVARICDDTLFIRAGPEIGVAASKTFTSQVVTLALLTARIAHDRNGEIGPDLRELLDELVRLPDLVQRLLDETDVRRIASRYSDRDAYFFIGRGLAHPVALEGALKFKELSYKHAEGFSAGELKHGPLALVTSSTPLFAVFTGRHREKTLGNVQEVQARGAPVVAVADESAEDIARRADETLQVPSTHPDLVSLLANVQLQLVSYYVSDHLDRAIDKPRNLAKSVTVE